MQVIQNGVVPSGSATRGSFGRRCATSGVVWTVPSRHSWCASSSKQVYIRSRTLSRSSGVSFTSMKNVRSSGAGRRVQAIVSQVRSVLGVDQVCAKGAHNEAMITDIHRKMKMRCIIFL